VSSLKSLFEQYDELTQDVAQSRYDFFQGNLERWFTFLRGTAPFAKPILQRLETAADFKSWFEPYRLRAMGHGTKPIEWPQERTKRLGIQLLLLQQFANGGVDPGTFALTILNTGPHIKDGIAVIVDQIFVPLSRELRRFLVEVNTETAEPATQPISNSMPTPLSELKSYEGRLAAILSRFTRTRDDVHIKREDDALFRQYVRELLDLLNDVLGPNNYSRQIAGEFNEGVSNFFESPSYKSVENIIGVIRAVQTRLTRNPDLVRKNTGSGITMSRNIFIVHGHAGIEQAVARFITQIGLEPIILHEQPNQGRTIIEKFESYSDVRFAVILLTPDDVGGPRDGEQNPRARQNVILELGYFIGKLGRERVCALLQGSVELPSDILGVVWEPLDQHGAWKLKLASELKAAKYDIDWSKVSSG
jgi:predicted nucleotide-binding protein